MTGRSFGMLGSTIWQSRRFNRLGSDGARLAFCYIISCDHGNVIGTYRLNPRYMAADRSISADQAEGELEDMAQVGLIDYDGGEGLIHIRRWFGRNRITNRNYLIGAIRSVHDLPQTSRLVGMAAADVLFSAFSTAENLEDQDAARTMQNIAKKGCGNLIKHHHAAHYLKDISALATPSLLEALSIHLGYTFGSVSKENTDTDRERIGRGRGKGRVRARKRATPETASAPKRAASAVNNNPSVVLALGAEYVLKIAKDKTAALSRILVPDAAQLDAMISKGLISKRDRTAFLRRSTA